MTASGNGPSPAGKRRSANWSGSGPYARRLSAGVGGWSVRISSLGRVRLAALLVALEPVVRQRLPTRDRAHPDVVGRLSLERVVDRAQANAGAVGLRPAAPEQVRPADRAERLRGSLGRLVGAKKLLAGDDRDEAARDAAVGGAGAAGELLAACAVAEGARLEVVRQLEADSAAETAPVEGHGGEPTS